MYTRALGTRVAVPWDWKLDALMDTKHTSGDVCGHLEFVLVTLHNCLWLL